MVVIEAIEGWLLKLPLFYLKHKLNKTILPKERITYCSRLRALPSVRSAFINAENELLLHYDNAAASALIIRHLKKLENFKLADENERMIAEYKKNAVISLASFAVLQFLKKQFPAVFLSLVPLRKALVLFIARKIIADGIKGAWNKKSPNADSLTATAVLASILGNKPESSLTLLALSNFAEMLTLGAAEKARKHISSLLSLDEQFVWRVDALGRESRVRLEEVKKGDKLAVHLGEKICVDGVINFGTAAIDQSSITGESIPVVKDTGSLVYAGTVVQSGQIEVIVEKVGNDTSISQILHLVEEAQTRKAPVQNFADKMANMLIPLSFISALLVYGVTRDWQRVLNMLFIDFSCGLKLSTATAISAAIGVAAKKGILIKGGNYIESLANIDTVLLDKTGTITVGMPQIFQVITYQDVSEKEVLLLAASAEMHSMHPLALAIQDYVKNADWEVPQHSYAKTIVARGMMAEVLSNDEVQGGEILVGSKRFLYEHGIELVSDAEEDTPGINKIYIARDNNLIGQIYITDVIRPTMKRTINQLRRQGIDEIIMLTGDEEKIANHVAVNLGLDSYHAELLPQDKAGLINKMQNKHRILMVGDGINDAPALAFADVGVAMGGRRTDIAVASSAITINSDDPLKLSEAICLGRQTMHLVQQNFTATLTINSMAMLLGALGKINPLVAALIHNAATIGVVLNSTRLLLPKKLGCYDIPFRLKEVS